MQYITQFVTMIAPYAGFILIGIFVSMLIVACCIINAIIRKTKKIMQDREKINKENLKNINMRKITNDRHGEVLRTVTCADGIDPNSLSYLRIMDGGHEKFIRTYTIQGKPKRAVFAKTFSSLFNFSNCTSSVFIDPISEDEMSRKLDRQVTILSSEYSMAKGDPNRQRKLSSQTAEVNGWAEEVENGENKFFNVGFLFSLYADSIQELNKISDSFYYEALSKGILVSNCYGMQAEAYALNGPYNGCVNIQSKSVKHSPVKYLIMDKYSVSTLFNYLQASFTHKTGIPIGRDMNTGNPVVFDLFDPSHDSMSLAIAGKPGSGKSLLIKIMSARQLLFGWHYVAIDSQQKKGTSEGEYAALAVAAGGINFQIRNNTKECLNLFDISETIISEKIGENIVKEVRTVDLAGKIATLVNSLSSMILTSAEKSFDSVETQTYVRNILTDTAVQTYHDFGIVEGDVNSLYKGSAESKKGITSQARKRLPTISDYYQRLLKNNKNNTVKHLENAYNLILAGLKDYVREIYYTEKSIKFLTRDEYNALTPNEEGDRLYQFQNGRTEKVVAIKGIRAYFDGQSTISINRDCPFVNFDISMLPDAEKKLARQIAIAWVNENFIKKNSEKMDATNKLVVILDEVHECYKDDFARDTVDITVREARKRYVGIILATQTLKEYDNYPETQAILKLVECKFVFKQDYQDRDYLVESLGITPSQADIIVGSLGGSDRDQNKKKHKGEMCIIDNKRVCFCKVDYLEHTEGLIADTDAATVAAKYKRIAS